MSDLSKYVIREISNEGVKNVATVEILADNTNNTWQHDRDINEKKSDTLFGKVAEEILYQYMLENLKNELGYIPYDLFRADEFKKHAPFDALLYDKNFVPYETVNYCIKSINEEISDENNKYGTLSPKLRNFCFSNGIYTVEVKSTKVNSTKMDSVKRFKEGTDLYYSKLIDSILDDDFIAYPHFCRDNYYIHSFDDYLNYVKNTSLRLILVIL